MKKILLSILSLVLLVNFANAQKTTTSKASTSTKPSSGNFMLLATVNLYSVSSTKVSTNNYKVSFQIYNRSGLQSDIRYGILLVNASTSETVDTQLSSDIITLGDNQLKNITMNYSVPGFVKDGEYKLFVVAENEAGILLAKIPSASLITVNNSASYPTLTGCNFLQNEKALFDSTSTLNVECSISSQGNYGNLDIGYTIHKSGAFGDIVSQNVIDQNLNLKEGNSTTTFSINPIKDAGKYIVNVFLVNNNKEKISSDYNLGFTISGDAALIQNTILDKTEYKKGDNANLQVFWSATNDSTVTVSAKISDTNGSVCGNLDKKVIGSGMDTIKESDFKIAIIKDCSNAKADITIKDKNGNILTSSSIDINNPTISKDLNGELKDIKASGLGEFNRNYVVIFLIVLVLIGYGIIVLKKDKKEEKVVYKSDPRNNKDN